MKILFIGAIGYGQTSRMRMRALQRLGHEIIGVDTTSPWMNASWLMRQVQRRVQTGPIIDDINARILTAAYEFGPDLVWAEKQEYLRADTLEQLRKRGAKLTHFTPDPYFYLSWKRTRLMDDAITLFDALLYCKKYESVDYEATGKPTIYFPLGYCDEVHRPLRSRDDYWNCDVGFLGGWEPRREQMLRAVAGCDANLKIWGAAWNFLVDGKWTLRRHLVLRQLAGTEAFRVNRDPLLAQAIKGGEVYTDDYATALSGARIGLGFLRAVCPDQHTTRTFEIPACGSMLLADRTAEHEEMFEEGREAEFFSSPEELLDKIQFYLSNEGRRRSVAEGGLNRCRTSRYAYIHRISDALLDLRRHLSLPS